MKLRLLCTDVQSESAQRLADYLSKKVGYKVFRSSEVMANRQHIRYGDQRDKLTQYQFFRKNGIPFPFFTRDREDAAGYMQEHGGSMVCRTLLQGQEGHGIVIADTIDDLVDAKVYVAYKEKTLEFRVNLFRGEVVNMREKRRKIGAEQVEPRIRNVENGYVYCLPREVIPLKVRVDIILRAKAASKVTDSDIVGVDIAYNAKDSSFFLLEVNSAPALEGATVTEMGEAIIDYFDRKYGDM